ncbi:hypothetical protein [Parachryseolinea silvisoli]|uniref:hypothetical protein n=1 Tax=Parachryseolinea silvisoli TaxID=2873601 RepID=UPI002265FA07|nr:hypothetical protein [Parachryseolinea silvisoli]MCD9019848.1 hypothetical protein [Parachryseolinea silvisoli]
MKYIRGRFLLKAFAVFFLLEIIASTVAPAVSWALTAGPTAPEATTFEPVDTTDVVDLKTGDFTYNVPLLEVPGPAGSYPVVLSHHGNVQPDQEASWVGLSWNVNPGAINRMVNGYPDDHSGVNNITRDFWEGGETDEYTVGVSVGLAKAASVSGSLSYANDTYRGNGIGWSATAAVNGITYGAGQTPYGQAYTQVGVTAGGSFGSGTETGVRANVMFNTAGGLSGGVGVSSKSIMDVSIRTDFKGHYTPGVTLGGVSSVHNGRAGKVSTKNEDDVLEIPIVQANINLRLGRSYQRYWIDESEDISTYGSLYGENVTPGRYVAFDTYDLLDTQLGMGYHTDGETVLGGSFSDVDSYSVTAQGLGGAIKPMFYQRQLYHQTKVSDTQQKTFVHSYVLQGALNGAKNDFRFIGDFSNRIEYDAPELEVSGTALSYSFSGDLKTGLTDNDGYTDDGRLIGSRHINWYKNSDILSSNAASREGFMNAVGVTRPNDAQIGGFSITNESGVTYHYALPAYSFDEVTRSQNTKLQQEKGGLYYNQVTRPEKYAYTWHLTSVTGPDFVDRNNDGMVNDGDWGYWVRFDYKKHLDDYKWRNPGEGYNPDIDGFDVFSAGKKEIYYLNKIQTQSHVAVFETFSRPDGHEVSDLMTGGFAGTPGRSLSLLGLNKITLYDRKDMTHSIRTVSFSYNYSLAPHTSNSFYPTLGSAAVQLLGKLTLTGVKFLGKDGADLMPGISFEYAKNKPYERGKFDMWGYYKSDYKDSKNQNLDRFTTETSAKDVDAWSLTNIQTPTGADIEIAYESDRYQTPTLHKRNVMTVDSAKVNVADQTVVIKFANPPANLADYRELLNQSKLDFMFRRWITPEQFCICDGIKFNYLGSYYETKSVTLTNTNIEKITNNTIEITDQALYDYLYMVVSDKKVKSFYRDADGDCYDSDGRAIDPEISIRYPVLVAGNLFYYPTAAESYGGGTRVREIRVRDMDKQMVTSYTYEGGVTSYEPIGIGHVHLDFSGWELSPLVGWHEYKRIREASGAYYNLVMPNFSKLLAVSRELPGPGVMYNRVTVKQQSIPKIGVVVNLPTYMQYVFDVFKEDMISLDPGHPQSTWPVAGNYGEGFPYTKIHRNKMTLKDYTSRIGNLREVNVYDRDTGMPVSQVKYSFAHDDFVDNQAYEDHLNIYNKQGVLEESTVRARLVLYEKERRIPYGPDAGNVLRADETNLIGVVSKREYYPSIATGQTATDFKTGIKTVSSRKAFDFYSGVVTRERYKDGYGNTYESETAPAYKQYGDMGPTASGGANMLTQLRSGYTYKMSNQDNEVRESLVSGWAQTWSDAVNVANPETLATNFKQTGIWRKRAYYVFTGQPGALPNANGFYPAGSVPLFAAWAGQAAPTGWQKNDEITLYDAQSHVLEMKDMNEQYTSNKMTADQQMVLAAASNAAYNEYAYTGGEDIVNGRSGGGIVSEAGAVTADYAHTGSQSIRLPIGTRGLYSSVSVRAADGIRKMHISTWVRSADADQQPKASLVYRFVPSGGAASAETTVALLTSKERRAGDWYLCEADVALPGGLAAGALFQSRIGNVDATALYVDDLRVHATDARIMSYAYNTSRELSHILGTNNLYTAYQYDGLGRLTSVYQESFQREYGAGGVAKVKDIAYGHRSSENYKVQITVSTEGPTGNIYPSTVSLRPNRDQAFEVKSTCSRSSLWTIAVDGKLIDLSQPSLTLVDGTIVLIEQGGALVTFKNIQSSHSLHAFFIPRAGGKVECVLDGNNYCATGAYRWTYLNDCGEEVQWHVTTDKSTIPTELWEQTPGNCCAFNHDKPACPCQENK